MKAALLLALLAFTSIATANPTVEDPPQFVMSVHSAPGESMDDFALRIASAAIDHSMRVSGEVCGEFRKEGDAIWLDLYTTRRLRQCNYRRLTVHDYTGLTFHTHIFIGITDWHQLKAKLMNPSFSDEDYDHPGYLASGKKVLFQNGRGTERRVR